MNQEVMMLDFSDKYIEEMLKQEPKRNRRTKKKVNSNVPTTN